MESDKTAITQRIKEIAIAMEGNISSFALKLGLNQSTIATAIKRGGGVGSEVLQRIVSTYPEVNPHWLLTGRGEMLLKENHEVYTDKNEAIFPTIEFMDISAPEEYEVADFEQENRIEENEVLFLRGEIQRRDQQIEKLLHTIQLMVERGS